MNIFIKHQIENIISVTQIFQQACEIAALEDDGKLDKLEAKQLKKINAAATRFIKELRKIK